MKIIISIISIFLITSTLFAQIRFSKLYPGENSDICSDVIVRDDGYIMSTSTDTSGYRCFRLIKVDLEGNVVWKKKYGYLYQQWYEGWTNSLFNTNDGGFVMIGTNFPPEGYNYRHSFLMKFNAEGDSLWTQHYRIEGSLNSGFHGIQTSDGGYAICGARKAFTDSTMTDLYEADALLIKTDSVGNMQWYNTLGSYGFEQANVVVQTTDGGYMLGGRTIYSYSGDSDWYLVKTDSLGNEQWYKTFGGPYDEFAIFGLIRLSDGTVLASGQRKAGEIGDFDKYKARLLKVNNSGNTIWDKEYGFYSDLSEPLDSVFGVFFSLSEKEDGSLYAIITKGSFQQGFEYTQLRSALMKLNSNGDSLYTRTFYLPEYDGSEYSNNLFDIEQTPDGGFVMAGYCHFNEAEVIQVPWLIKVDSLGDDGTFIRSFEIKDLNVSLFPNPTSGNFLIEIPERQHENYIIRLHSLTGVLLLEKQAVLSTVTRLDISSYQSGLYLVTIEGEQGIVWASKVMKVSAP